MFTRIKKVTHNTQKITAIIETCILTLLSVGLGEIVSPSAPFYSIQGFSWLSLAPFLVGLRYGFAYAVNSSLVLIAVMWAGANYYEPWIGQSFSSTALSVLAIAIISGEFRNYWHRKLVKLETSSVYLDTRLSEVSSAFQILKNSHDRLVQRIASRSSLRDSILGVREHILKVKMTDSGITGLGTLILRNFADYISIQQAGLYIIDDDGAFNFKPVAVLGGEFKVDKNDLLLKQVLEARKTVSLKADLVSKEEFSHVLLLAIPLMDVFGQLWGVVLVNRMPFRSFKPDNIQLASILAGHIADIMSMRSDLEPMKDPELQSFIVQVMRLIVDVQSFSMSGMLVALELSHKEYGDNMAALIIGKQRGLDSTWLVHNRSKTPILFVLLPLTDSVGMEGYRLRLLQLMEDNYQIYSLEQAGINIYPYDLSGRKLIEEVMLSYFIDLNISLRHWSLDDRS